MNKKGATKHRMPVLTNPAPVPNPQTPKPWDWGCP